MNHLMYNNRYNHDVIAITDAFDFRLIHKTQIIETLKCSRKTMKGFNA